MNIKQSIKKILACATASAMTLCLTMPTAFADDTTNNAKEAYISKTYNTEVGFSESLTSPSPVTCVAVKLNVSAFPTSVL